ncbi:MAG: AraC family transcriptional regulator N-terminal domain-containing protein [Vibrio sp.]
MSKLSSELAATIAKHIGDENLLDTPIKGMHFSRWPNPTEPTSYTLAPSICIIAQGQKRVMLGEEDYIYDQANFLISSVDLPVVANIMTATPEKPYLGLVMELDLKAISQLIVDSGLALNQMKSANKAIAIGELNEQLLDAFKRLVDLIDEPESIKILEPVIKREIFYRLLTTNQGLRLSQMVTAGSHSHHIAKAIDWLKEFYAKPLNVNELASDSGMSKSAFYSHFRSITAMTPLQFQKKLRLNEARRLMLTENLDAITTTFKVGYESPSQFNREYSRMFGNPPARDIKSFREANLQ